MLQNNFLKCLLCPTLDLNSFQCITLLSQKTLSTSSIKNLEKCEKCQGQRFRTFVFFLNVAWKPYPKNFIWPNFDSNNFKRFVLLLQQTVSIRHSKIYEKLTKCRLQKSRTFVFHFNGASKSFFQVLLVIKFGFPQCFTPLFQKIISISSLKNFPKKLKMLFSKVQKIRFFLQRSFKTIF